MTPRPGDHVVFVDETGRPCDALLVFSDSKTGLSVLVHINNSDVQWARGVPHKVQHRYFYWCMPQEYAPE